MFQVIEPVMSFTCISFDLDGTLVDTASEISQAANRTLEMHGLESKPPGEITALIGRGGHDLMLSLLARSFLAQPSLANRLDVEDVLSSFDEHYARAIGTSSVLYDGAREALFRLREHGIRLACVTNKDSLHVHRLLGAHGLADAFDLVLGGDSLPERKPHASVLRHAARVLRVDTGNFAHVGDSFLDVEAARNAGVTAWAVPYGFNSGIPIGLAKPNRIFENLLEVADYVIGTTKEGIHGTQSRH